MTLQQKKVCKLLGTKNLCALLLDKTKLRETSGQLNLTEGWRQANFLKKLKSCTSSFFSFSTQVSLALGAKIIIIIINGISNAHNHRNVPCSMRYINSLLISLSLGETLLLEPFDGKVYDLLPVFLPELWSCPSNHLCLAPIFWLVFLSLSFRLS